MSTTIAPPDPDDRIEELLDQLIPRPGPPWRRFALGITLTATVVAAGLSWSTGLVAPNPTARISYGGSQPLTYVAERNAVAVSLHMPNRSRRDIRLTGITLDAPGVRLVEVGATLDPVASASEEDCTTQGGRTECVSQATLVDPADYGPWPRSVSSLPFTVPAGQDLRLHLLVDPTSCQGPDMLPWGQIDATFDFGDGAFPGWSRTIRLQNPLAATDNDLTLADGTGNQVYPPTDGRADDGLGLLAAACRLMQDS